MRRVRKQQPLRRALTRFVVFLVLVFSIYWFLNQGMIADFTGYTVQNNIPVESGRLNVTFCQQSSCWKTLEAEFRDAHTIACAFYELGYQPLITLLEEKEASGADVELLVFKDEYEETGTPVPANHGGLMHDKFCIINNAIVITGSMNPTYNGVEKNDNNLVVIEGNVIVENYVAEFAELAGVKSEKRVAHPVINHTNTLTNNSFLIENYFCPEDGCEAEVLAELGKAEESILFMTFAFTSDPIGDLLVEKIRQGVTVKGVFERRQNSRYSEKEKLAAAGADVSFDANPQTMHHKVFIIDAGTTHATVVTGSYNPTANGNKRNDENVLIIHDETLAEAFTGEFERLRALTTQE